jgi:methyltransferase
VTVVVVILALVTLQRIGELWLSNRNTRRLLAHGAREFAPGHYPLIVAVHVLWLAALWWLAPGRPLEVFWLGVFVLLQLGRGWVIATLGERWTTRIIVLPGAPLVRSGPYRLLSHPNYVVVAGEIAVLPMAFGLWHVSLLFSILNAAVLAVRIREENRALAQSCAAA